MKPTCVLERIAHRAAAINRLPVERRAQVVNALIEGNSVRSTVRLTGVAKGTILKLLAEVGAACAKYQHDRLRNLTCRRIQCDEIWSFCGVNQKNISDHRLGESGLGDVWVWVAICAESKLVSSWLVGGRDGGSPPCSSRIWRPGWPTRCN